MSPRKVTPSAADLDTMITQEMRRAQRQHTVPSSCHFSTTHNMGNSELESNPLGIPSPFLRLPPELLLHIFKATVPPLYQHDPSVIPGPRNPWLGALRTRKALVLTCKTFFAPATEVLYEDIVFRRMGQIPALARTLGAFPPPSKYGPRLDFGALVRRIRMDGCVIWAPCADVVREDLGLILRRCIGLRSFSFHPHPQFPCANDPSDLDGWDMFNPAWLVTANDDITSIGGLLHHRFATSLRTFDLAMTLDEVLLEHLHWFLSAARHLAVLKLGAVAHEDDTGKLAALPTLTLPALRELQIHVSHPPFESHVAQRWTLPHLHALTLLGCAAVPEALLAAHGARLTYLHVRHGEAFAWDVSLLAPLARLPTLCPALEHLVVPTWHRAPLPVHSPTLRWLDVWGHHPPPAILRAGYYQLARDGALPRFEKMRILGTMPRAGWGAALSVDWPRVCHPSAVVVGGDGRTGHERVYDFPGARVVQTAWGVIHDFCQEDLTFSHGDGVERRDNSGEYVYVDGGDAEDDGMSVVSDETGSFHASFEEEGEGEDDDIADFFGAGPVVEPFGRDGMLERFRESQDRYYLFEDD